MSETEEFITESMRVTAEPMLNTALLQEAMDLVQLADEHDLWDQSDWMRPSSRSAESFEYKGQEFCETACCFAGWTTLLDGWKPQIRLDRDGHEEIIITKNGKQKYGWQADGIATELLGLSEDQADDLFDGDNTMEDLQIIVKALIEGDYVTRWDRMEDDDEE